MRKKSSLAVVCGLALCALLCGCGDAGEREVIVIGREEPEDSGNVAEANAGAEGVGTPEGPGPGETSVPQVYVYVCGAVSSPGVVVLPEGSRAEDALKAAGGFADDAWRDYVNLAERVSDGEKLYFPTLEESEVLAAQEETDGRININTADVAQLCTLPGIGESRARDIIAYREANGAFESCEDIMKVSGIKTSVYGKISDKITVK